LTTIFRGLSLLHKVRRYIPPSVGDVVEVKVKGQEAHYDGGTTLHANGGGFYVVEVDGEGRQDLHENSFHQTLVHSRRYS
jgi:hypothetical protein